MEKNLKKNIYLYIYMYIYVYESLCYTPETSTYIVNQLYFN